MRFSYLRTADRVAGVVTLLTWLAAAPAVAQETPASQPADPPASQPAVSRPIDSDLPAGRGLLEKALETMGGREAFEKIRSSRVVLSSSSMGGTQEVEMLTTRPASYVIRRQMGGVELIIASDGRYSWSSSPMGIQATPDELSRKMANQARIHEVILQVIDEFKQHRTVGVEAFGGVECYKIKLDKEEPVQDHFVFVDAQSHQPVGLRQPSPSGRGPQTVRFLEWKPAGEIMLFRKMEIEEGGVLTTVMIVGLEFDKVDPAVFKVPDEIKAKAGAETPASPGADKEG